MTDGDEKKGTAIISCLSRSLLSPSPSLSVLSSFKNRNEEEREEKNLITQLCNLHHLSLSFSLSFSLLLSLQRVTFRSSARNFSRDSRAPAAGN